jgi:hypothetical protein
MDTGPKMKLIPHKTPSSQKARLNHTMHAKVPTDARQATGAGWIWNLNRAEQRQMCWTAKGRQIGHGRSASHSRVEVEWWEDVDVARRAQYRDV